MNLPFQDDSQVGDQDQDRWSDVRDAMIGRLTDWVDTVGETDSGRQQIAVMVDSFDASEPIDAPESDAPESTDVNHTDEIVQETLMGLSKITAELTALRHDLKSSIKQSRSFAETLAADAQKIVSASTTTIDQIGRLEAAAATPPSSTNANSDDQVRSMTALVIEADEAVLRLRDAFAAVISTVQHPTAMPRTGWLARSAVANHHDQWSTAWKSVHETIRGLADGLRLTVDRMTDQINAIGLQRIGTIGENLDPHSMQVLEVQPASDQPPGTVLRVLRFGYQHHGRVIRPAQVSVAGGQ
ncbi:MAG: nucleotide exchange factor GrpE [Rubripirellula sp.]